MQSLGRWILFSIGGLLGLALVAWLTVLVSMRIGYRPVMTAIRRFNRGFSNPRQMKTAGQPGAYAAVIHHVGRRTGTAYQTPVGVIDTGDALLITLPYGPGADWVQNVLAAGSATVVHEGETLTVIDPEVVSADEVARFHSRWQRFVQALYGVDSELHLPKADAREAARA